MARSACRSPSTWVRPSSFDPMISTRSPRIRRGKSQCAVRQHGLFFKKNRVLQRRAKRLALMVEKRCRTCLPKGARFEGIGTSLFSCPPNPHASRSVGRNLQVEIVDHGEVGFVLRAADGEVVPGHEAVGPGGKKVGLSIAEHMGSAAANA